MGGGGDRAGRARLLLGGAAQLIDVRPIDDADRALVIERWGHRVVRRGESVDIEALPGFVAWVDGQRAGLLTYAVRGDECEVVTLHSLRQSRGAGRALMDAVRRVAESAGCRRLWLVTTNDNLRALAFYQRWGLDLCAFRRGAVDESRRTLKPSIPERDEHGVPIAHELELERLLT